ncbi:3-methyl-2-oxobutanoate hydroxymethyltransferase, partial [Klebsiella pneumoniae]
IIISCITAYDYPSAKTVEESGIDMILVGDSVATTVLGLDSTIQVSMDDMIHHTKAVKRGAKETFTVVDMPFSTVGVSVDDTVRNG